MTYLVIGICVFLLITVIIIAAKPISMGIEARRNINNNNDDEKEKENNDVYQTDESNYKISDEIESLFIKAKKTKQDHAHSADKTGKSKLTTINFTLSSGDRISIQCYDWTKKMKYWDNLRVGIYTKEFTDWLNREAYK